MISKINELLKIIEDKKKELLKEYIKLKEKYNFRIEGRKVIFDKKSVEWQKRYKQGFIDYMKTLELHHILSMPFIYMMIIPGFILDIFLTIYQHICFRLYCIPIVKRKEYFIYDRRFLEYLNWMEKINCLYCSYMNGLFSFAVEIGGRTEQYWCPIKASRKLKIGNPWQKHFADYGDPEGFRECFNKKEIFYKDLDEKIN